MKEEQLVVRQEQQVEQVTSSRANVGTSIEERFPHLSRLVRDSERLKTEREQERLAEFAIQSCPIYLEPFIEMEDPARYYFIDCMHATCNTCAQRQYQEYRKCPMCSRPARTAPRKAF